MSAVMTAPGEVEQPLAAPSDRSRGVGAGLHRWLGAIPTVVLWLLVGLWSIPTLGVLVSSFRQQDDVRSSGWWSVVELDTFATVPAVVGGALLGSLGFTWAQAGIRGARSVLWVATGIVVLVCAVGLAVVTEPVDTVVGLALGAVTAFVWSRSDLGRHRWWLLLGLLLLALAWLAVRAQPAFHTDQLTVENYEEVFSSSGSDLNMGQHFLNSAIITIPATIIPVALAAFAAYAFAWMDFKGRHWLFIGVVALLAVPFQMSLVPLLQLFVSGAHLTAFDETFTFVPDLDLAGTTTAVWLTHIGFGLPLAIFLLHNYIAALPRDLFEAARIDGADHPTIFWRLVLPLSVPALAAFAIFQFLWVWNDFLVARTFLGSGGEGLANAPMTVRLATVSGSYGFDWHLMTAAAFVSIAVPLVVFFALQRYFVRGLLAGSVKG